MLKGVRERESGRCFAVGQTFVGKLFYTPGGLLKHQCKDTELQFHLTFMRPLLQLSLESLIPARAPGSSDAAIITGVIS